MEVLDEQGVETALLLPTLALNLEALLYDDAPAVHTVSTRSTDGSTKRGGSPATIHHRPTSSDVGRPRRG